MIERYLGSLTAKKIFDRKQDGGYPNLTKINELNMVIGEKVFEVEQAIAAS